MPGASSLAQSGPCTRMLLAPLGGGDTTIKVEDVKNDFHFAKRKEQKTWINTGMFVQIWTAIRNAGHHANHNWVIKADADAVFFPSKLLEVLHGAAVPAEGLYMENCKFVSPRSHLQLHHEVRHRHPKGLVR